MDKSSLTMHPPGWSGAFNVRPERSGSDRPFQLRAQRGKLAGLEAFRKAALRPTQKNEAP